MRRYRPLVLITVLFFSGILLFPQEVGPGRAEEIVRRMKDTFIRILEPKKEEGFATLRLGNEMWNYLPKAAKVLRIPPSMMMSSWMGSDFTNDDLVKEYTFVESYSFEMTAPEAPESGILYVKCVPKEGLLSLIHISEPTRRTPISYA